METKAKSDSCSDDDNSSASSTVSQRYRSRSSKRDQRQRPKVKRSFQHKYHSSWEKKFCWISSSKRGATYFFCKSCNTHLLGGIAAVKKHDNTSKHINNSKAIQLQRPITEMSFTSSSEIQKTKELEVRVASFIVEHNIAINAADHLEGLLKECANFPEATKNIKMKRTKCAAVIKNVIGEFSFSNLIKKLQKCKFSMMIDESTDNSCVKNLAIIARFTECNLEVHDNFLALIPVADATASNIYQIIVNFFQTNQVDYKSQLIGFSADGANTMTGSNHSVQTLLKNDIPHLAVLKCICHSLALCASNACLRLPRVCEDLLRDIHTYFQYSFKRKKEYEEFQHFVEVRPHKMLYNSQTRWLSLLQVVRRVIEQYDALRLYFQSQYLVDRVQASEYLFQRLSDPINLCYLEFMEFILPYIMDVNVEFQAESPRIHLLYSRMTTLLKTILEFYIKPRYLQNLNLSTIEYSNPNLFMKIEDIYLGSKIAGKFSTNQFSELQKNDFRKRCLEFYIELMTQLFKRFPVNSSLCQDLKLLEFIYPPNIKKIQSLGPVYNSVIFKNYIDNVNDLDREWRLLRNNEQLNDFENFGDTENVAIFWKKVIKTKRGDGSLCFPNLTKLIELVFTLPHSNAAVERIFSVINLNKTKIRNRLNSETLSGILHSKRIIQQNEKNCFTYDISKDMIKHHNYHMYNQIEKD